MNFLDKNKFPTLNFPFYSLKITNKGGKAHIWDNVRRLWLVLTIEEWVRQHVMCYMVSELGFSAELLREEHPVEVGTQTNQRIDILGYSTDLRPLLLVECKAPSIKIDEQVLSQAVRYNSVVGAKYIMLTNGLTHFFFSKEANGTYKIETQIPTFF